MVAYELLNDARKKQKVNSYNYTQRISSKKYHIKVQKLMKFLHQLRKNIIGLRVCFNHNSPLHNVFKYIQHLSTKPMDNKRPVC